MHLMQFTPELTLKLNEQNFFESIERHIPPTLLYDRKIDKFGGKPVQIE